MDTVLSGIRSTGNLHLGNYFGAVKNFVRMQQENRCFFFVADYHSLTTHPTPEDLHNNIRTVLSEYLAAGLDPEVATLYIQSDVPEIPELYLLLNMNAYVGELERTTTFKEKIRKQPENINAGLLTYPVLMCADIIIHNADGSVATELSAKCSNDVGEVVRALERYPEYQIIGSSELAAQHPDVIDAGMSDADIAETVGESFEAAGEVGEALDIVGDILPGLPIIFVAGRHGVRLVMGKTTFEKAVRTAAPQLIEAGVFTGIGFGLAALDMGLFSIPVMIFGKFLWGWIKDRRRAKQYLLDAYSNLETIMSQRPRFAEE